MLNTRATNDLILISENGLNNGVKFIEEQADEIVKNGYIQPIDGYLPVKTDFEPIPVILISVIIPKYLHTLLLKEKDNFISRFHVTMMIRTLH